IVLLNIALLYLLRFYSSGSPFIINVIFVLTTTSSSLSLLLNSSLVGIKLSKPKPSIVLPMSINKGYVININIIVIINIFNIIPLILLFIFITSLSFKWYYFTKRKFLLHTFTTNIFY